MNRILLFLLLIAGPLMQAGAQGAADSSRSRRDTVLVPAALPALPVADTTVFVTPKKTALFSAIVPGLGQFHNKHYWKIGLIYAGVGVSVYFLNDNITNYNRTRRVLATRVSEGRTQGNATEDRRYANYTNSMLEQERDYYRRNLDLTVLLTGVGYALQVMDAVVFAHLKGFDISEDISLNARPVLTPQGGVGFGLVLKF